MHRSKQRLYSITSSDRFSRADGKGLGQHPSLDLP